MAALKLSILYLGPIEGTCLDRANALRRLGHDVTHLDPRRLLPRTSMVDRITWILGGGVFSPLLRYQLKPVLVRLQRQFDLCYVDGGEWISPKIIFLLRSYAKKVVNYNIDDPLGPRDGGRSRVYRQSLRYYDLCVVMRPVNVVEAQSRGAIHVMRVFRSADEISHAPRELTKEDYEKWHSKVLFLGTWMPERGPFLVSLIRSGVPLTIRGSRWQKAPEWEILQPYWKGDAIKGDDYAKAIQCADISLGLLSKGNRDLHTTRSLEIPALGSLLCAERTEEHIDMYVEGVEAMFWSNAQECATLCQLALSDEKIRKSIARAGHRRVKQNGHYNEIVVAKIIKTIFPEPE